MKTVSSQVILRKKLETLKIHYGRSDGFHASEKVTPHNILRVAGNMHRRTQAISKAKGVTVPY